MAGRLQGAPTGADYGFEGRPPLPQGKKDGTPSLLASRSGITSRYGYGSLTERRIDRRRADAIGPVRIAPSSGSFFVSAP